MIQPFKAGQQELGFIVASELVDVGSDLGAHHSLEGSGAAKRSTRSTTYLTGNTISLFQTYRASEPGLIALHGTDTQADMCSVVTLAP